MSDKSDKDDKVSGGTNILNIAIAGFGTVGSGVSALLERNRRHIFKQIGVDLRLLAVANRSWHNESYLPAGFNSKYSHPFDLIDTDADIMVEVIGGEGGDALEFVKRSLKAGKHVVTANKAMLAHHGLILAKLAEDMGVQLNFEASICGSIPVVKTIRDSMSCSPLLNIRGILNGSCNYILSEMEAREVSYNEILEEAQKLGYAEVDPTLDVDGIDAAHKLNLLTKLGFGIDINFDDMVIRGISKVTLSDVQAAREIGGKIRLVGVASLRDIGVRANGVVGKCICQIAPVIVGANSIFGMTVGSLNVVELRSSALEKLVLQGYGAGRYPTGHAVLSDIIDVASGRYYNIFGRLTSEFTKGNVTPSDTVASYLVRLNHNVTIDDLKAEQIVRYFRAGNESYVLSSELSATEAKNIFVDCELYELI